MIRTPIIVLVVAAVTAAAVTAAAATGFKLSELSGAYRSFDSYQIAGTLTIETFQGEQEQPSQKIDAPFRLAGVRQGRVREQVEHSQIGTLSVCDGDTTWTYIPARNQYFRRAGCATYPGDSATSSRNSVAASLFSNYRNVEQGMGGMRELESDTVRFAGRVRTARVVEVTYPTADHGTTVKTFWIDRESRRVLRHRMETPLWGGEGDERRQIGDRRETVTYDRIDINRPVPDSLFSFTPPPGARDVEREGEPPSPYTGKQAADFTLKDLAGKDHRLQSLRGKVVMLDFWATWCGPCRMQMPLVEKLGREFAAKGLVVYAVNQGEPASKAKAYLDRNGYSTTTLLDARGEVGSKYGVSGIPTLVIIGKDGTISAHYTGVHGEADLRAALRKTGIE